MKKKMQRSTRCNKVLLQKVIRFETVRLPFRDANLNAPKIVLFTSFGVDFDVQIVIPSSKGTSSIPLICWWIKTVG